MINPFDKIENKDKIKLLKSLESHTMTFEDGKEIQDSVDTKTTIGIIVDGFIQIEKTDYNGSRSIVDELETNEVFGYNIYALTDDETKFIAKDNARIIFIEFNRIMNSTDTSRYSNQFVKNLFNISTNIINDRDERIKVLTKKTIRNKLLEYFEIQYHKNNSKNIYLPSTISDLADYLAIDRSAMSREMKYLKEEGFISLKGHKITLLYK